MRRSWLNPALPAEPCSRFTTLNRCSTTVEIARPRSKGGTRALIDSLFRYIRSDEAKRVCCLDANAVLSRLEAAGCCGCCFLFRSYLSSDTSGRQPDDVP